ncbi:MAG: indole-3-glycerol phosphate synthase TrpC [Bacteroidota bacterium]
MNFLETILAHKREEITARKKTILRSQLEDMPKYGYERHSLQAALSGKELAIIAEIKKASPSKDVIRQDFDPLEIARAYLHGGASALSVLTDERFFQGNLEFIDRMRHFVPIPILRKDFILDPYQLYEARAYGADAVLLIAFALESAELNDLMDEARVLGLECLVEVHDEDEIAALDFGRVNLVGINNRDLATFETDIMTSVRLKKYVPATSTVVSESGITSRKDIDLLMKNGIHAFLVGELFMRSEHPGKALEELLNNVTPAVK